PARSAASGSAPTPPPASAPSPTSTSPAPTSTPRSRSSTTCWRREDLRGARHSSAQVTASRRGAHALLDREPPARSFGASDAPGARKMRAVRKTMNAPVQLGQSIVRKEDRRFLTGRGRYADNTAPADALAVLFVRSPHAHARIVGIDKKAALAAPGVVAIYTAEDTAADKLGHLPAISEIKDAEGNRHREPPRLPMPEGKVRHVGDIVAMILAETLDQARDASELL